MKPTFGDATLSEISGDIPLAPPLAASSPARPPPPSPDACSLGILNITTACIHARYPSHIFTMSYVIAGRAIKVSWPNASMKGRNAVVRR